MVKNKRKFNASSFGLIALSLMLVASLVLGLTGAWFTDTDSATSNLTFGEIKLGTTSITATFDNVMPGDTLDLGKFDYTGPEAAYYRVSYVLTDIAAGTPTLALTNANNYGKLAAAQTNIALDSFVVPTTTNNDYQAKSVSVTITIDAIQQANVLTAEEVTTATTGKTGTEAEAAEALAAFTKVGTLDFTKGTAKA